MFRLCCKLKDEIRAKGVLLGSGNLNRLRYHWRCLTMYGPRYPLWLLRRVVIGRQLNGRDLFKFDGRGLEIGGPSRFFEDGGEFPIYTAAESLDNINYNSTTFWGGTLKEGCNFKYHPGRPAGRQFIREASDLSPIASETYDFIASCHTLEHCANPIKALQEWRRVLKANGWLALVLPHKAGTFDHRRAVTQFEHLVADYRGGITEDDSTHLAEILEKHDLRRDPAQKSRADFEKWIGNNVVNRGAHHHVFDPKLAAVLVDYAGFDVKSLQVVQPFHIFAIAQKLMKGREEKGEDILEIIRKCHVESPFKSDHDNAKTKTVGANFRQSEDRAGNR